MINILEGWEGGTGMDLVAIWNRAL